MDGSQLVALGLTALAGMATGLGAMLVLLAPRDHRGLLAASLGFSAGVMIWVSFVELYPQATAMLAEAGYGSLVAALAFFAGMAAMAVIDIAVPEDDNPHILGALQPDADPGKQQMWRTGRLAALAIAIHNFPEGMATLLGALHDPRVGVTVALAVGLHNLPEGIAVAMPLYNATGDRARAIRAAFLAGLAEPLGALVGLLLLGPWLDGALVGALFAAVAGVMVFLSLDQLLPNARRYDAGHASVYGLVLGMAVSALGLALTG